MKTALTLYRRLRDNGAKAISLSKWVRDVEGSGVSLSKWVRDDEARPEREGEKMHQEAKK